MSAYDVDVEILGPMQTIFLPPRGLSEEQQTASLKEYSRALEGFDAIDLKTAWNDVRDSHTTRGWPVIGQFVLAARVARKARVGDPPRHSDHRGDSSAARWLRWVACRSTQLAADACEKNVAWALKCSILSHGLLPDQISLSELFIEKAKAEETRDKIERGELVPSTVKGFTRMLKFSDENAAVALKMWQTLQIREEETQDEIRKHNAAADRAESLALG